MYKLLPLLIVVLPHLAAAGEPTGEIRAHIYLLSAKYGIDEQLIHAIVATESAYNVKAVGRLYKERGLMQLRPKYFPTAKFDVATNLKQGVKYLALMREACYDKYGEAWFICYNTGPNARRVKNPTKHAYYRKVMRQYQYGQAKKIQVKVHARSVAQSEGGTPYP